MAFGKLKFIGALAALVFVMWKCYSIGFDAGYSKVNTAVLEKVSEIQSELSAEKTKLEKKLSIVDAEFTAKKHTMQGEIDKLRREASNYEPPKPVQTEKNICDCSDLDSEWVRIHNAAANLPGSGGADPTSVDDDEAKAAGKDIAIEVVTGNYAMCAGYINQLEALQEFINSIN